MVMEEDGFMDYLNDIIEDVSDALHLPESISGEEFAKLDLVEIITIYDSQVLELLKNYHLQKIRAVNISKEPDKHFYPPGRNIEFEMGNEVIIDLYGVQIISEYTKCNVDCMVEALDNDLSIISSQFNNNCYELIVRDFFKDYVIYAKGISVFKE